MALRTLAALVTGGAWLAHGLAHGFVAETATIAVGALGIGVQLLSFLPGRVVIGDDGVFVRWLWSRTFVRRSAIAQIERATKTKLRILRKDGSVCEIVLAREASTQAAWGDLALLAETAAESEPPRPRATWQTLAARVTTWARQAEQAPGATAAAAYRSGEAPEQLWEIAADVDAPALARIGAVHALGPLDAAARTRVRELAASAADPLTADALDAAAAGDTARMRALLLRSAAEESALAVAASEASRAQASALVRPNVFVLALASLSRLWFVAPAVALATHSHGLSIAAFVAGIVGAMPWAAATENDPLARVVSGRALVDGGFITHDGKRVLDLARVKGAYVHRHEGAPPVVRFVGSFGWPLLDCRMDSLDDAKAFLRGLPLREDQRDARFGSMEPDVKPRYVAFAAAAALVAVVMVVLGRKDMSTVLALAGLMVSPMRLRRLLTVEREALVVRSVWTKRRISFDDIEKVERRKNAGVVVLRSGERFPLRTVLGEPTMLSDDDLTETLIDRFEEHQAARAVRARVALVTEPEPARVTEREEEEATEEPAPAKAARRL